MRRILTLGASALAVVGLLSACSSNSSSSSKSSSTTAATSGKSGSGCLVGSWQQTTKEAKAFESDSDVTYSTPKGRLVFTFKPTGNFDVLFDEVSVVATANGASNTLSINGSVGGTYTVNNNTFTTNTTKENVSVKVNGVESTTASDTIYASLKDGDKSSQSFSCSGGKLTITDDTGSYTLSAA